MNLFLLRRSIPTVKEPLVALPLLEVVVAVTRFLKFTCFSIFVFFGLAQKVFALAKGKAMLIFNLYKQDSDGGNQIYGVNKTEDVKVLEPMLFVDYQIDKETNINAHFVFDAWSAASDTEIDGNTGASGEGIGNQARTSGRFGYAKDKKTWAWSSALGVSNEYDYRSLNFGGSVEGRFAQENFVVSLSPQVYLDQAKDFDLQTAKTTEFKGRSIWSMDLSASQLLSRLDIIQFGYTFIHMNGMMNNISNTVKVNSNPYGDQFSRMEERMPDKRKRHAFSSKWVHGFSEEKAMHVSYRYYSDDWKVKAHTAELGFRFSLDDDETFIMPSYRYYSQEKAEFFGSEFATPQASMTSDSDLNNFESHRLGLHYSTILGDKEFSFHDFIDVGLTSGLYYSKRSDGMYYGIAQFGLFTEF
jgi:hypothetical protein